MFLFFFFLFAANSLVRSWWYREAYIKPWQPTSPDTSQSGKIFLIYLVIPTFYTSFRTSKYNVAVRGIYLNVICVLFFCLQPVYTFFWATKYNVAVKDVLNIIWMLFVGVFCLQPTVSSEVGDTEKHTSSHGSQTPLAERTPNREVKIFIIIDLFLFKVFPLVSDTQMSWLIELTIESIQEMSRKISFNSCCLIQTNVMIDRSDYWKPRREV